MYIHNNAFANPSSGASAGALTEDGAGGAYNNTLANISANGMTLTLRTDSPPRLKGQHFVGAAVYVLSGRGAGQFRRILSFGQGKDGGIGNGMNKWHITSPFAVALQTDVNMAKTAGARLESQVEAGATAGATAGAGAADADADADVDTSFVAIGPYRGKFIWTGNTGVDNQGIWLWGSAINVVVADNVISRSQAFVLWPLDDHNAGPQPNFRVQVLNNRIVNGNTYFHARWQCAVPGSPVAAASRLPPCKGHTPDVVQSGVGRAPGVTIQSGEYNSSRAEFKNIPLSRGVIIR